MRVEDVRKGMYVERGGYKGTVTRIVAHGCVIGGGTVNWYTLHIQPLGTPYSEACGPMRADTEVRVGRKATMSELPISERVLSVVQEPAEPYESFIGRVLQAAVDSGEVVPASRAITQALPPVLPVDDDTEIVWVNDRAFVNSDKHEQVCAMHVARCDDLRAERDRLKARLVEFGEGCPDAEVCNRCPCAADDDACFPGDRLRAERDQLKRELEEYEAHITPETRHAVQHLRTLLEAIDRHRERVDPLSTSEEDRDLYVTADRVRGSET